MLTAGKDDKSSTYDEIGLPQKVLQSRETGGSRPDSQGTCPPGSVRRHRALWVLKIGLFLQASYGLLRPTVTRWNAETGLGMDSIRLKLTDRNAAVITDGRTFEVKEPKVPVSRAENLNRFRRIIQPIATHRRAEGRSHASHTFRCCEPSAQPRPARSSAPLLLG